MVAGQSYFIKKNPIATKRALRAILKAVDIVARDPVLATKTADRDEGQAGSRI